jgi:HTH-type transcriptional regulator / antitoxin HigA
LEKLKMIRQNEVIKRTIKVWPTVSKVVSTIHSQKQYKRMINLLDELLDEVSKKSDPVKESLIDTLGTLIKDFEDRNIKEPKNDPVGVLKYLLDEHGLSQNDLQEIGSQGVVSEILSGKRKLNLRQITALSKKFSVSPLVFIDVD